ncbi:IDEAL domain-containing protein [Paenisporosarcina cavernae]|uniref:IDEAL domain-containing protein n=1 Tax=Paenisporosarcina cavernae TaxID=2320858 RepID=A0A385YTX8_9BACL|nr:IDEAL domain-containing protein [Paenisporosarcina cavernae]AYC30126.1 IDEAL domain-containing protein [Paenisporosarcina cavernae]
MDKYYSYTDFLKAMSRSHTPTEAEKLLNDIYMDLFLNHVHREQRKEKLTELIDLSLDEHDEVAFLKYTHELEILHQQASYY